jgi:peptidoglycan/xylan/chitin deacetylase (PgdA/CDA1 family)
MARPLVSLKSLIKRVLAGRTIFWRGSEASGGIALSFDDGPLPRYTPEALAALDRVGVKATFFLVGRHVLEHPDLARAVVAAGHEVGLHTFSHCRLGRTTLPQIAEEVRRTEEAFRAVLDLPGSRLLRPPYGAVGPAVLWFAWQHGFRLAMWSRDVADLRAAAEGTTPPAGGSEWPAAGEILLFHDDLLEDIREVPNVVIRARERGLRCGTVSEVMPT